MKVNEHGLSMEEVPKYNIVLRHAQGIYYFSKHWCVAVADTIQASSALKVANYNVTVQQAQHYPLE